MMALATVLAAGAAMAVVEDAQRSSAGRDAALDRALEELVSMRGGPPGVIAVVQRDEVRKVHTAGVADLSAGRPIGINNRMRIASTSKAFSGAAALSLVSKGALSLNDTIGEVLPKQPKAWREITLRQLLNHSSGLPEYVENPRFGIGKAPSPEKLLSYIKDMDLRFDPGSRYEYSNSDNIVVALMVQSVTNSTYNGQLQEQVYGPLDLK